MAHEITATDHVVLHKEAAWHGLGTVVADAPTPAAALRQARLDWQVDCRPLQALGPKGAQPVTGWKANYRSDTDSLLGIVGKGYQPIQNAALAEFCGMLAEGGDTVRVESAGSIRGGQKVWFLLKGDSFSVRKEDEVCPYYCISNGHDGWTAFRCTPTTVRVVCSNTLHMVIPAKGEREGSKLRLGQAAFVCHHTLSIAKRVEEAKAALGLYGKALDGTREVIDALAAKEVKREDVQRFFLECYVRDFGAIPTNPKTAADENKLWASQAAFLRVAKRFDAERQLAGATYWNAYNAYTGWLQNDNLPKLKDAAKAAERKLASKLFGVDAQRAHAALATALALAT